MASENNINTSYVADVAQTLSGTEVGLVKGQSLPEFSRVRYEDEYGKFCEWCNVENVRPCQVNDEVFLAYLSDKSKGMKPNTLWSRFSMIKTCLKTKENLNTTFPKTVAFLKRQSVGYTPNRGSVFTGDEITKFMVEAPDNEWLLSKVILVFYIFGFCRRDELVNLNIDDVKDCGSFLTIFLKDNKRYNLKRRDFTITDEDCSFEPCTLVRKYLSLRPSHMKSKRFLVAFRKGKCVAQHVGCHSISGTPKKIATYLKLKNPESYKGSAIRTVSTLVRGGKYLLSSNRNTSLLFRRSKYMTKELFNHQYGIRSKIDDDKTMNQDLSGDCPSTDYAFGKEKLIVNQKKVDLKTTTMTNSTPAQNANISEIPNSFTYVNVNNLSQELQPDIKEEVQEAEIYEPENIDEDLTPSNILNLRMEEKNVEKHHFAIDTDKYSLCSTKKSSKLPVFANVADSSNQRLDSSNKLERDSDASKSDDESEWFGSYVTSSLRALRHESSRKRLKSMIHSAIKEVNNVDKMTCYSNTPKV